MKITSLHIDLTSTQYHCEVETQVYTIPEVIISENKNENLNKLKKLPNTEAIRRPCVKWRDGIN